MNHTTFVTDILFQLNSLSNTIKRYTSSNEYIYSNRFEHWVEKFNNIVITYNRETNGRITPYEINTWDYSSTQKTVRQSAIDDFNSVLDLLIKRFESEVENIRLEEKEKKIPFYQMRKCFKIGKEGCSINPALDKNKVFIGMPFDNKYRDSYEFGIKVALGNLGLEHYRADSEISNIDIMCKICRELQSCQIAIFNISGLNPNVMLELGLAYGIGKPVIIIKDSETRSISDLGSIEYIEYSHAHDLMLKLMKALER